MKNEPAKVTLLSAARIYQIKVTLKRSKPPIWRRIQVSCYTSLGELHDLLQIAMGWEDVHMHMFIIGGTTYGDPDTADAERDEFEVLLDEVAEEGDTLIYEYDFGDDWVHELEIEKVLDPEPGANYPHCLAGKRACPPEDCGGVPGYERMLAIFANPKSEAYEDILEWLGEEFDPEAFDVAAVNDELKSYAADPRASAVERPLPVYDDSELAGLDGCALVDLLRRDGDRAPRNLIDACAARGDAMIQALRQVLDSPQLQASADDGDWWLSYHAAMIAGLIPTTAAGTLLVDLMRQLDERDDVDMQDWLAGYWPALLANKTDVDDAALRAIAEESTRDILLRVHAADAVHYLALQQGAEQGEAALDWIAGLASDEQQEPDSRIPFGFSLLHFPRERHRPLLEKLVALQRGYIKDFDKDDITRAFDREHDTPEWERFTNPWQFYEPAQIEARQQRWAKESSFYTTSLDDTLLDWGDPYVRPEPKVGRNDPCPCGSGKKYKKCCLGKV